MAAIEKRSTMLDFIVQQKLGSGSYGNVYKVQRKADKQFYAIKEVNVKKLQQREREDAVNEIRILASIKHKNICRYCDAFVEKDNLYIVMEFAEHGDISRQIEKFKKANKYIKEDTVWSYFIQICQGLNAMHSRNVLHRDIKSKNIFLTGKCHVRLGDLGCAKLLKAGMAKTQIGTPYYMSPEIWSNKPYDAKADVWAVGCLLYELCMLQPPFLANDMNGLANKIKTTTAPRISKHYSEDLANMVASMLSRDPKSRPSVDAILAHSSIVARMSTLPTDEDDAWAGEEMRVHMISTIKVPSGYNGSYMPLARVPLPAPNYPTSAPSSSSDAGSAPAPSASAPAAAAAAAPTQQPPSIPSTAAAPSSAAASNFASATSPPHLGRPAAAAAKENGYAYGGAVKPIGAALQAAAAAAPASLAPLAAKRPLSAAPISSANALAAAAAAARPGVMAAKPIGAAPLVGAYAARPGIVAAAAAAAPSVFGARPGVGVGLAAARPGALVAPALNRQPSAVAAQPSAGVAAAAAIGRYGVGVGGHYGGVVPRYGIGAAPSAFAGHGVQPAVHRVGMAVGGGYGRPF